MIIELSPTLMSGASYSLVRDGADIIIDGVRLNTETLADTPRPDGGDFGALVGSNWVVAAGRTGGVATITLLLPHGPDASEAARFPAAITDPSDGPVALPTD